MTAEFWAILGGVIVATISAIAAVLSAKISSQAHREIKTNHGKSASEYIEEIHAVVADVPATLALLQLWADLHTQEDTQRFDELKELIEANTSSP
jgi:hypothetical protein